MYSFFKKRLRGQPIIRRHFDGTFFNPKKNVVSLKKRVITVELSRESFSGLGRFFMRSRIIIPLILLLVVVSAFTRVSLTRADTVLYPQNCLGGWQHPELASGLPDVAGQSASAYSDSNSASVSNQLAQMYCGNFAGTIPEKTMPTRIVVKFSVAVGQKSLPLPVTISSNDLASTSETFASTTNIILDTSNENNFQLVIPIATATDTTQGASDTLGTSTPAASPDSASTSPEAVPPNASPNPNPAPADPIPAPGGNVQSFLLKTESVLASFFLPNIAQADDAIVISDSSTTSADTQTSAASTSAPQSDATSTASASSEPLLAVSYTLDGTTWNTLGTLAREDLPTASFDIPVASTTSWSDISKLQISVQNLSTVDDASTIYLDGVWLEALYVPLPEITPPVSNDTLYHILVSGTGDSALSLESVSDESGKDALVVSMPPGTVAIYGDTDKTFRYTSEVGDTPLHISEDFFPPGAYTVIMTGGDACAGLSEKECLLENTPSVSETFSVDPVSAASSSDTILPR